MSQNLFDDSRAAATSTNSIANYRDSSPLNNESRNSTINEFGMNSDSD